MTSAKYKLVAGKFVRTEDPRTMDVEVYADNGDVANAAFQRLLECEQAIQQYFAGGVETVDTLGRILREYKHIKDALTNVAPVDDVVAAFDKMAEAARNAKLAGVVGTVKQVVRPDDTILLQDFPDSAKNGVYRIKVASAHGLGPYLVRETQRRTFVDRYVAGEIAESEIEAEMAKALGDWVMQDQYVFTLSEWLGLSARDWARYNNNPTTLRSILHCIKDAVMNKTQ